MACFDYILDNVLMMNALKQVLVSFEAFGVLSSSGEGRRYLQLNVDDSSVKLALVRWMHSCCVDSANDLSRVAQCFVMYNLIHSLKCLKQLLPTTHRNAHKMVNEILQKVE